MKFSTGLALAAAFLVSTGIPAAGQERPVADPAQDAGWHNAQSLALASRQVSDGWGWLPGGVLIRHVSGDGKGERPSVNDTVTLHYAGTLADGTPFDSSYDSGRPATFPLRALIRAWQVAVPHMAVGDVIEIAVPSNMGYGAAGAGPIPGGATLLFKIELLGIQGR